MDLRGRAFVDTTNTRLLLIENDWKARAPTNAFSTYQQLFAVLSRHDQATIDMYLNERKLDRDPYVRLAQSTSAHISEQAILKMFWWLWIVLASLAIIIHLGWHLGLG